MKFNENFMLQLNKERVENEKKVKKLEEDVNNNDDNDDDDDDNDEEEEMKEEENIGNGGYIGDKKTRMVQFFE